VQLCISVLSRFVTDFIVLEHFVFCKVFLYIAFCAALCVIKNDRMNEWCLRVCVLLQRLFVFSFFLFFFSLFFTLDDHDKLPFWAAKTNIYRLISFQG